MKRFVCLIFTALLICTFLVSCSGDQPAESNTDTQVTTASSAPEEVNDVNDKEAPEISTPTESEGSSILVAYFSTTGTTEKLAEYAAEALGADIYEITPAEPTESRLTRRQDPKFPARSRIWRNTTP